MAFRRSPLWEVAILFSFLLTGGCAVSAATLPPGTATPVAAASKTTLFPVTPTASAPAPTPEPFLLPTLIPTPTDTPTITPTPTVTPPVRTVAPAEQGIWISQEELAALPMEGEAWEQLKETADGELEEANIAGYTVNHDVQTLAVALVYARTGDQSYREKAAQAIRAVMGTEHTGFQKGPGSAQGALAVNVGRNLVAYVIAADLINLARHDAQLDSEFREWIARLVEEEWPDGSLIAEDERRANNHGRVAGASRVAVAAYLGDEEELMRAARVFKGFLGDREAYAGFVYNRNLSWQADLTQPVGINPKGAVKAGLSIDGALPEEMRRACSFRVPPCHTDYPWGALQGIVVEANILHRQGFDVWNWEDQAILRAVQFLYHLQEMYEDEDEPWWADGDDTWVPWMINDVYGTAFPTEEANIGKNMGWTDWTHAPAVNEPIEAEQ